MITPIFPVPLYVSDNVNVENVSEYLQSLETKRVSSDNGYTTTDQQLLNHAYLFNLKDQINKHITNYVNQIGVDPSYEFYINCSWGMEHQKGDWSHTHKHNNSLISGIVYIDVDDNSGAINFECDWQTFFPEAITPVFVKDTLFNSNKVGFTPSVGTIVLFPSFLSHSVDINMSDIKRRCIAFNVFVKGIINDNSENKMSYLKL